MLLGCSKRNAPAPGVSAGLVAVGTTADGQVKVMANFTNGFSHPVLVSLRSMVMQTNGLWVTNFSLAPFMGLVGPNSFSSDAHLSAQGTLSAALSPQRITVPFRLEFVCFPARSGLAGVWDVLTDKAAGWKDGGQHRTYRGESFVIASPVIVPAANSDGAKAGNQPNHGPTTRPAR